MAITPDAKTSTKGQLVLHWIILNKGWIFSGIGVFLLSGLLKILSQSSDSPSQGRPEAREVPAVVETELEKSDELGGEPGRRDAVQKGYYEKLFAAYLNSFTDGLKPNSVEHILDNSVVEEIAANIITVRGREVHASVTPWNYASLFREQLKFFEFREAIPLPSGYQAWQGAYDDRNPIDQLYYQIGDQVKGNLRAYFSDRKRLESFYYAKRSLITGVIVEQVPLALRSKFVGEIERAIDGFKIVLSPSYRRLFEDYLEIEQRYLASRYGNVSEEEMLVHFQRIYDRNDIPVRSLYPTFAAGDRIKEKPVDGAYEEELGRARKAIFEQSPNIKASAFAYRRYLEGGEELVEGYIAVLEDLRTSAFVK